MDIPIKFIFGWLIVIIITYSIAGYVYNQTYETPKTDAPEGDPTIIDIVAGAIGWFINTLIALFRVFFFALPNMPPIATVIINLIIQPINIVWLMGIYPFIRDLANLVIESGKTFVEFLDAIIPF